MSWTAEILSDLKMERIFLSLWAVLHKADVGSLVFFIFTAKIYNYKTNKPTVSMAGCLFLFCEENICLERFCDLTYHFHI